jgi:hypothetical protein
VNPRTFLFLALGALPLAACGGGNSGVAAANGTAASTGSAVAATGASSTPTNGGRFGQQMTDEQRAQLKTYADCLSSHGVTIPRLERIAQGNGQRPTGGAPTNGSSLPNAGAPNGGARNGGTPNGGTPPSTIDQAAFTAADAACAADRPAGIDVQQLVRGFGGGPGGQGAAGFQQLQAYFSCLSDHGVKTPDFSQRQRGTGTNGTAAKGTGPNGAAPTGSAPAGTPGGANGSGGPRGGFLDSVRNDPNFAAADQICHALLPAGFGNSTPSTTATTTQGG